MAGYTNILGKTSAISHAVVQGTSAASALLSSNTEPSSIRDAYLNGFFAETSKFTPSVFARIFDEPTYLTFRIEFNFNNTLFENKVDAKTDTSTGQLTFAVKNLNDFPEPLLAIPTGNDAANYYSTYNYLNNALGEVQRGNMLRTFIKGLKDIQENYPYYFQSVEGLGDLLKVAPAEGIRLKDDENSITVKCLEGLDLKITQLLQLYKNVAWDDYYQRWILSDMMRFFNMKIYVSEIRLFHSASSSLGKSKQGWMYDFGSGNNSLNANSYDRLTGAGSLIGKINDVLNTASAISSRAFGTNSTLTKVTNAANQTLDTATGIYSDISSAMFNMCNNAINDVMPTICFDCHQCEFNIEDNSSYINTLNASMKNSESPTPTLKIKIGKLFVKQVYPLNADLATSSAGNSYVININKDKEIMPGSYFSDEYLMTGNNSKERDFVNSQLEKDVSTNIRISKTTNRMYSHVKSGSSVIAGVDAEKADNEDLAYRTVEPKDGAALLALTQGIVNLATGTNNSSQATNPSDGDIKNIRNNFKVNMPEASNATRAARIPSNSENQLRPDTVSKLQAIYNERPEAFNNAVNALAKLQEYSNDLDRTTKSMATSAEGAKNLKENIIENVLENLSKSAATDSNTTLAEFANIILDETRSSATDSKNKISGFNLLN